MKEEQIAKLMSTLTEEISGIKMALFAAKPVYTHNELMILFGVSARTIRRWRDAGLLGYSQVGDTYLYSKKDVEAFLLGIHHSPQTIKIRR